MAVETQNPLFPLQLPHSPHQSCGCSSKDTPWRGVPTTPSGWEGPRRAGNGPDPPPSTLLYLSFVTAVKQNVWMAPISRISILRVGFLGPFALLGAGGFGSSSCHTDCSDTLPADGECLRGRNCHAYVFQPQSGGVGSAPGGFYI